MYKFKEGDIVEVVSIGQTYDAHKWYAAECELDMWINGDLPNVENKYIVIRDQDCHIVAVECMKYEQQFLVGEIGLKYAE